MASRIMHLAVSKRLEKIIFLKNVNNFRIGHILPDAVIKTDKKQANTHFIINFEENGRYCKLFDYYEFYDRFKPVLFVNKVYLGYYFHLIEDNIFRSLLYTDLGILNKRSSKDFLNNLYKDYGILNQILIEKYGLKNDLKMPQNFTDCKINDIYNFEIKNFLDDLSRDFQNEDFFGSCMECSKILTEKAVDGFIEKCVKICKCEYDSLIWNRHFLSERELAFEIN